MNIKNNFIQKIRYNIDKFRSFDRSIKYQIVVRAIFLVILIYFIVEYYVTNQTISERFQLIVPMMTITFIVMSMMGLYRIFTYPGTFRNSTAGEAEEQVRTQPKKKYAFDEIINVSQQGFSREFNEISLKEWLVEYETNWLELATRFQNSTKQGDKIDEIKGTFSAHASGIARVVQEVIKNIDKKDFSRVRTLIKYWQNRIIVAPEGPLANGLFDKNKPIDQCAYIMCFLINDLEKIDMGDGGTLPIGGANNVIKNRSELSGMFGVAYKQFQAEGGQSQVLFDLATNTIVEQAEFQRTLRDVKSLKIEQETVLLASRQQFVLEPAASRWDQKKRANILVSILALMPFVGLLSLPIYFWTDITSALATLWTSGASENGSLSQWVLIAKNAPWTVFVFFSAPLLFVAWVLKHFSRVFVQNLNLAADAAHRAAMAGTYSRMVGQFGVDNPELAKIVYQALFHTRDVKYNDAGEPFTMVEEVAKTVKSAKGKS